MDRKTTPPILYRLYVWALHEGMSHADAYDWAHHEYAVMLGLYN